MDKEEIKEIAKKYIGKLPKGRTPETMEKMKDQFVDEIHNLSKQEPPKVSEGETTKKFLNDHHGIEEGYGTVEISYEGLTKMLHHHAYISSPPPKGTPPTISEGDCNNPQKKHFYDDYNTFESAIEQAIKSIGRLHNGDTAIEHAIKLHKKFSLPTKQEEGETEKPFIHRNVPFPTKKQPINKPDNND